MCIRDREELALRQAAGFPPFTYLALLRAEAKHAEPPLHFLQQAKSFLLPAARGDVQDVLLSAARGGVQDVLLPAARGEGGRRPDEGRSLIELHLSLIHI